MLRADPHLAIEQDKIAAVLEDKDHEHILAMVQNANNLHNMLKSLYLSNTMMLQHRDQMSSEAQLGDLLSSMKALLDSTAAQHTASAITKQPMPTARPAPPPGKPGKSFDESREATLAMDKGSIMNDDKFI